MPTVARALLNRFSRITPVRIDAQVVSQDSEQANGEVLAATLPVQTNRVLRSTGGICALKLDRHGRKRGVHSDMENQPLTLLNLAHLPWDHVWQRPQHLMSRFASRCRVIYVDPPVLGAGGEQAYLQEQPGVPGVRVLRPIFPDTLLETPGNSYWELWHGLLPEVLAQAGDNTLL